MSMRYLKILIIGLLLVAPGLAAAKTADIPGSAVWYFHIDLAQMRDDGPGQGVYLWLEDEAFADVKEEAGVDLSKELDSLTAFSLDGEGPVILFEGNISQDTKDKIMTFIAASGDINPSKSSGKAYYHFKGTEGDESIDYSDNNIEIQIDSLEEESCGSNGHNGALLVLTAEKTMLQAGMNSAALGDEGDSDWESNILRNTEQVAFLMAAAANKLALEAKLITSEPEMAESLASVVRGLISLMSFNDEMDAETVAMLQGTTVKADGNSLTISLAIDPDLVIKTISD
jgi:hypothetical protein